jgi:pimeloyl-ACP methyl ester carboxylesterase
VRNRFRVMGLPAFPSAELMVFWGSVQHGFNGFAHNPADYAGAVQCPALVLHGEQDTRATTAEARAVYDRLPGPKQFVDFPGAGHDVPVAGAPQAWQAPVARFLAGALGAP